MVLIGIVLMVVSTTHGVLTASGLLLKSLVTDTTLIAMWLS